MEQFVLLFRSNLRHQPPTHFHFLENSGVRGLLHETRNATIGLALHNPELCDLLSTHRLGRERDIGSGTNVLMQQRAKIHPVKLVATQDQEIIERAFEEIPHVLAHRVGRSLIPLRTFRRLLRRQDVDETAREIVELVASLNMSM